MTNQKLTERLGVAVLRAASIWTLARAPIIVPGDAAVREFFMKFSFIHAADLHLGSPFIGLSAKDETVAARFASASREAFIALIDEALARKISFLLIAGDLFDSDWKDAAIGLFFIQQISRLARQNIPTLFVSGNHDAGSAVLKSLTLPENVKKFSARAAGTEIFEDLKVAVHGRSFGARTQNENYAVEYPAPKPGYFNIGLLHTSLEGNAAHAVYAPCSLQNLIDRDYDYWALGHIHAPEVLRRNPYIVYSGNLQGRSVRECGPRGAMAVHVSDGAVERLEPMHLDRARWMECALTVQPQQSEDQIWEALDGALRENLDQAREKICALRVTLTGQTPLHASFLARRLELEDDIRARALHRHDDVWLEKLKISTRPPSDQISPMAPMELPSLQDVPPDLRLEAQNLLNEVKNRLPGKLRDAPLDDLDDLDALLEEARFCVGARAAGC